MKRLLLLFFCSYTFSFSSTGQVYVNASSGLGVDLDVGSTNYSNCTTVGNKSNIQFAVSGVGVLSATNALASVNITFNASCGGNIQDVMLYIKSPSGTCMRIYNGANATSNASGVVNVALRDGSCLREPNNATDWTTNKGSSGHFGVFRANAASTMSSVFNAQNANGTWTIYAWESTVNAPCITSASLVFANPTILDQLSNGDNCSSPIVWTGQPLCAQTNGKTGSTQMPGSMSGPNTVTFGTIGGMTCDWNNANNNDVWIRFTATAGGVLCISVSGLQNSLQSIVVKDANADGDNNACTQNPRLAGNDPNWVVASCPRSGGDAIYGTTAGVTRNQQHCFPAQAGEVFYLVVDGNGGAESPFYVTGVSGPLPAILEVSLLNFSGTNKEDYNQLDWTSASEKNHKAFIVERSSDGKKFFELGSVPGAGTSTQPKTYRYLDVAPLKGKNYYRLKMRDDAGNESFSNIVVLVNKSGKNVSVYPNPVDEHVNVSSHLKIQSLRILNATGQLVYKNENVGTNTIKIPSQDWSRGRYMLIVTYAGGNTEKITLMK